MSGSWQWRRKWRPCGTRRHVFGEINLQKLQLCRPEGAGAIPPRRVMPKTFWTYAGRMAFSILGSVAGALIVSHFGLLQIRPEQKLEKIVFDQSDLTRYDNITQRVEAGHIAMRELKARQEADARKKAAAENAEKQALAEEAQRARAAAAQAAAAQAAAAQAERRKVAQPSPAPKRETVANVSPPAAPLVITPADAAERPAPARDGLEGMFDKLASGVGKIRDFVVNAVRLDKPSNLPFGSASTASDSIAVIDDVRGRLRLPAFEM
jgi:hypothetical protein